MISADALLERMHIKRQLSLWRVIAICVIVMLLVSSIGYDGKGIAGAGSDYIARVTINDIIVDDPKRNKLLNDIKENDNIKAVILSLDTPGGTALGGEALYRKIKSIRQEKPVVAVMRTLCTSAGYMAAISADRIYALDSTITGSIGVIMQSFEVTEMADKLGINPIILKSSPNKASPNPLEKFTDEQREITKIALDDFFNIFIDMVIAEREIPKDELLALADGRIYTGRQALSHKLIDEIGGEEEAINWLIKNKEIDEELEVRDVKVKKDKNNIFEQLAEVSGISSFFNDVIKREQLDGMLLIWQPHAL